MKKLIIIFFFFAASLFAQGSITTPFDTTGWDAPASYTDWYGLRIYNILSNPGGGYSRNMRDVDSLLYELVVYTDNSQLWIQNDTLKMSDSLSGMAAFTSTDQYDTVTVNGLDSNDVVIVTVREAIPAAEDRLGVFLSANTLIVGRAASGTSGLKYNWVWIRKY